MAELKPCIWCKSNLLCVTHDNYADGCVYYVKCRSCGSQGPHVFRNEQQAIDAWNKRS